jgi:hypothetical protein
MASKLEEYIATGGVADTSAPPAPESVVMTRAENGDVIIAWSATSDEESGIKAFVVERDGKAIGQVPEKPVGRFGRSLFQTMSYHDTPELPLPEMRFVDTTAAAGVQPVYSVRTINSVDLVSEPAIAAGK